ncbi:MAG: hypothetical protein JRI97_05965 [Deltaproteobacteria bacterium]|nr:hypothetical protein [Deltaproteobacteria bacterium]
MEPIPGLGQLGAFFHHFGAVGLLLLLVVWIGLQNLLADQRFRDAECRHHGRLGRLIKEMREAEDRHRENLLELTRKHEVEVGRILAEHKGYMQRLGGMYEANVRLVKSYEAAVSRWEKLTSEVMDVISLNTQTQTRLADSIKHNDFCPLVREKGPNR